MVDFGPLPSDLPEVEEAPRMPAGFRAGAVRAGIKESGRPDLGVLAADGRMASVAAVFTTNRIAAAPVRLSRHNLAASGGQAVAIVSTSGSANAATGRTANVTRPCSGRPQLPHLGGRRSCPGDLHGTDRHEAARRNVCARPSSS